MMRRDPAVIARRATLFAAVPGHGRGMRPQLIC
jgi:hypothetical protein